VAALAQPEEIDPSSGFKTQSRPPGLWLIPLPFMDDLRRPEADSTFCGPPRAPPHELQIAAAAAMIRGLQLEDFSPEDVPNPALQRHYAALEAKALKKDPLTEVPPDKTLPDVDQFAKQSAVILHFREAAFGAAYASEVGGGGKKRKAPVGEKQPAGDKEFGVADVEVREHIFQFQFVHVPPLLFPRISFF
jgi:ATP-dependent DNA helicase 2 subunit 1